MNLMTPEEARLYIRDAEELRPDFDKSWRALDTIAGMHEEWGVSYRRSYENAGRTEWGWATREDAERSIQLMSSAYVCGIVRRYVTTEEEA